MGPLVVGQIGQALDLLLGCVVVKQSVNSTSKVRLGLLGELFNLGELAQVSSDELELGRGRVLVEEFGQVLYVFLLLFVVVKEQVGSLVRTAGKRTVGYGRSAKQAYEKPCDDSRKHGERSADTAVGTGDDNVLALQLADTLVLASVSENVEDGLGVAGHVVLNTGLDILHGLDHLGLEGDYEVSFSGA